MQTHEDEIEDQRVDAALTFWKRTFDARFSEYLDSIGWQNPQRTITMLDHQPVSHLVDLIHASRTPLPFRHSTPSPELREG